MQGYAIVDTHNHCKEFSPDASQPLAERIEEAQKLGFAGIVITDHYDKDPHSSGENFSTKTGAVPLPGEWIFNVPSYISFVHKMQEQLAAQGSEFKLLLGIELGYVPQFIEKFVSYFAQFPFDQIVAAVHNMDLIDVYYFKELYNRDKLDVYRAYLTECLNYLQSLPQANILAHFDYISRYAPYEDSKMYYRELSDSFDALFEYMIARDIALEINIGTQRSKHPDGTSFGFPDPEILLQYKKMGGKYLTIASDAHHKGYIGRGLAENIDYVRELGFTHLTHYEQQEPVLTAIS